MKVCGGRSVEIMKEFVGSLEIHSRERALDMAGSDGRFTVDFLLGQYGKVDIFDQCKTAYKKALAACKGHPNFGFANKSSMQMWEYAFKYCAIYMVWCVGYLNKPTLI